MIMNSPHGVIYAVIAFMLFSSVVSILYVSIQNYRAVKKYYKGLQADKAAEKLVDYSFDTEVYEEVSFFPAAAKENPAVTEHLTNDYSIAS
jgi:hypothetical protein